MSETSRKLAEVRERIEAAAARSGRSADDVRLIAVSKTQSVDAIRELVRLGQQDFAENQMQEALDKIPDFCADSLEWHFIGHLQSNKTRLVPANFAWVHTIDSVKLARRIAQASSSEKTTVKLLLQVNVSADPAKHGVSADALFPLVESILEERLDGIALRGLMTIGYRDAGPLQTQQSFAALRRLLEGCRQRFGEAFSELSMGMSGDYELAIEEGATMVRVGSALFGPRATCA